MFRIKICGVRSAEDAAKALAGGADMIGLNFYEPSPRCVSLDDAAAIAAVVPQTTGVFVNANAKQINDTAERVGLECIQLHGDEPPELLGDLLEELPIVRVRNLAEDGLKPVADDLLACQKAGRLPDAVLVDARVAGQFGGTGRTVEWAALENYERWLGDVPLILAGGLTPDNVAQAIRTVRPYGVDTASGVESSPGIKDHAKMLAFIKQAQAAFDLLDC